MTPKDTVLEGDFLGQILAADSLPGAFVHSRKSIGEGASSLVGGWPSPENVSCSRATLRLHRCKSGVALEQETLLGTRTIPQKDYLPLLRSI